MGGISIAIFKQFVKNVGFVYSVNIINGILGVIAVPLAVHFLGAPGYGIYSIYTIMAAYVALIDLGVTKNLTRTLAGVNESKQYKLHLQTTLGLYIMISVTLLCLLPLLVYIVPTYIFPVSSENIDTVRWIVVLSAIEFIISVPAIMMQSLCVAKECFDRYSAFSFLSGLYRYGLMYLGILIFHEPVVVVALVVGRRFVDIYTARKIMGGLPGGSWAPIFNLRSLKSVIGNSIALSFAQLSQITVISIGSVLVNGIYGLEVLGLYRSSFDIATKVWFFSNGIGLVVFPRFVQTLKDQITRHLLFNQFSLILKASWAGYALLYGLGIILSPYILNLIGLHSPLVQSLFIVLLLGVCINAHANLSYEFLQATGRYWAVAWLGLVALIIMVISFYGLNENVGIMAIGWAWVGSQLIFAIFADSLTLYEIRTSKRKQVLVFFSKTGIFLTILISTLGGLGYLSVVVKYTGIGIIAIVFLYSLLQLRCKSLLLKIKGV